MRGCEVLRPLPRRTSSCSRPFPGMSEPLAQSLIREAIKLLDQELGVG